MAGSQVTLAAAAVTVLCLGCQGPVARAPAAETPDDGLTGAERARLTSLSEAKEAHDQGLELLAEGRPEQALGAFQRSLALDPLGYQAHFQLGLCYYQLGQYDLEIGEYQKCLAINPRVARALKNLGHAQLAADELGLARNAYQRYLALEPKDGQVLFNMGLIAVDLGLPGEAKALFQRCRRVGKASLKREATDRLRELERR